MYNIICEILVTVNLLVCGYVVEDKMKSIRRIVILLSILCSCFFVPVAIQTYAKTTEEKMSEAEKEVEQQEKKIKDAQKKLENMEETKAQLEGSLAALNNKLNEVSNELTALEEDLSEKQKEIDVKQAELDVAVVVEQQQYDCMKKRIKYLYELGTDTTMFQSLLESESFADMLNKADYFSQITVYDRRMLEEYQNTKNQIAQAKQALEQNKADIEVLIAQREEKQAQVQQLVNEASKKVAQQSSDIEAAQSEALKYEEELKAKRDTVESLQSQLNYEKAIKEAQAREESNRNAGNGKAATPSGGGSFNVQTSSAGYDNASSSSNLDIMAAIIYCEAGAEPYAGQLAVGSVIMNRIQSSYFPNTLLGVLYQKSQFTPVMSGRFAIVLSNGLATSQCYQAAQEVLNGVNTVPDCLFFRTVIDGIDGQIIGTQIFY